MNAVLTLLALQLPAQEPQHPLRPVPQVRLSFAADPEPKPSDPILLWNEAMLQAIRVDRTPPPKASIVFPLASGPDERSSALPSLPRPKTR